MGICCCKDENNDQINPPEKVTKNDYSVKQTLGKGVLGTVYLVSKKKTDKLLAIKAINKSLINQWKFINPFQNRWTILYDNKFPFLVPLYNKFETSKSYYLVLEFCDGGELFFHLRRQGNFTINQSRFYAAELLLALELLHKNDIKFRDLKPENILLDADGHLKLSVFGFEQKNQSSQVFDYIGPYDYLAPEILKQ